MGPIRGKRLQNTQAKNESVRVGKKLLRFRRASFADPPRSVSTLRRSASIRLMTFAGARAGIDVVIIGPVPEIGWNELLCKSTCLVQRNDQILYRDTEHLTTQGADLLRPSALFLVKRQATRRAAPTLQATKRVDPPSNQQLSRLP
jgi:hypothetical protein